MGGVTTLNRALPARGLSPNHYPHRPHGEHYLRVRLACGPVLLKASIYQGGFTHV